MGKTLTQSEFARLANVTPQNIHNLSRRRLFSAMRGHKIDPDHPSARAYLAERSALKSLQRRAPASRGGLSAKVLAEVLRIAPGAKGPAQFALIAGLTVDQVIQLFPYSPVTSEYVSLLKKIEGVHMVRLQIAERESTLSIRSIVADTILPMLIALEQRSASVIPKTIAARCYALAKNNAPMEDAEAMVRGVISQHLKGYVHAARLRLLSRAAPIEAAQA